MKRLLLISLLLAPACRSNNDDDAPIIAAEPTDIVPDEPIVVLPEEGPAVNPPVPTNPGTSTVYYCGGANGLIFGDIRVSLDKDWREISVKFRSLNKAGTILSEDTIVTSEGGALWEGQPAQEGAWLSPSVEHDFAPAVRALLSLNAYSRYFVRIERGLTPNKIRVYVGQHGDNSKPEHVVTSWCVN